MKYSKSYIINIQFLGFRFHGWQKQPNLRTLHEAIDKTLQFVLNHSSFKTLGVGRTDAKVSANAFYFQLFSNEAVETTNFVNYFNSSSPLDIKAISIKEASTRYNIIQQPKIKEYVYLFSFGKKTHPYAAPLMVGFEKDLDIEQMKLAASLFEGTHYFHKYCTKPSDKTIFERTIMDCSIEVNTLISANFFPKTSYVLRIRSEGFLRYQVRLIMGALLDVGLGELSLDFIKASLKVDNDRKPMKTIAPGSGLQLYAVNFKK